MTDLIAEQILADPHVLNAISRRRRLVWSLVSLIAVSACSFCLFSYAWPEMMMSKFMEGSYLPLGFLLSQLILVLALVVCFVYSSVMNRADSASSRRGD